MTPPRRLDKGRRVSDIQPGLVGGLLVVVASVAVAQQDGFGGNGDLLDREIGGGGLRLSSTLGDANRGIGITGASSVRQVVNVDAGADTFATGMEGELARNIQMPQGELNRSGVVGATRLRMENGTPILERGDDRGADN